MHVYHIANSECLSQRAPINNDGGGRNEKKPLFAMLPSHINSPTTLPLTDKQEILPLFQFFKRCIPLSQPLRLLWTILRDKVDKRQYSSRSRSRRPGFPFHFLDCGVDTQFLLRFWI